MTTTLGFRFAAAAFAALTLSQAALAQLSSDFYVGIDSRTAPYTAPDSDGGGDYPDNPNNGRLTLLFAHGNHFHGIGAYSYTGAAASPTLNATNSNNRLPEGYSLEPPLPLIPGAGAYAGSNTTQHDPGVEYSHLEIRNVQSLAGTGIPDVDTLFHSSSNRWDAEFDPAHIHLELVSTSSPWLHVGSLSNPNLLSVGGDTHLGDGDEMFSLTPVLWVDEAAPAGDYWAEFRLTDLSGTYGDSGSFYIDVRQVPEPAAALLAGLGLLGTTAAGRRRR